MDNRPVAGIDVSKYFSDMCILSPTNEILHNLHFKHDFEGMSKAKELLDTVASNLGVSPVVIMESTSHYHRLFFYFLKDNGFDVILINPLQSHGMKNVNIRKVKSDKIDAYRIALLYRLKELKQTSIPVDTLYDIRNLTRQYADLIQTRTMFINRLTADLDQVFPSFKKVFKDLAVNTALNILKLYPSPEDILAENKDVICDTIRATSRKGEKYAMEKTEKLFLFAEEDKKINIRCISSKILIQSNVNIIQTINENTKTLTKEIETLVKSNLDVYKNVNLLDSIPGISFFSATVLIAEIGDFSSFKKPSQLVAYFGVDPSTRQSGMFKGTKNKISKRGNRYLRRILNMIAVCSVMKNSTGKYNNPVLAEYFIMKKSTKPHKVALCAVMNKLVHIIFAVLRNQKPFELRKPEEHAQWLKEKNIAV